MSTRSRPSLHAFALLLVIALTTAGARWAPPLSAEIAAGTWSAPGGVNAGLALWYDASEAATIALRPRIKFWFDKSGSARDFRATGTNAQPYATVLFSRPMIYFASMAMKIPIAIPIEPITLMAVLRMATQTSAYPLIGSMTNATGISIDAGRLRIYVNGSSYFSTSLGSVVGNHIITVRTALAGADYASLDGGVEYSVNAAPTAPMDQIMGIYASTGDVRLAGAVMELVVWDRALTAAERLAARRAIAAKWGITVP